MKNKLLLLFFIIIFQSALADDWAWEWMIYPLQIDPIQYVAGDLMLTGRSNGDVTRIPQEHRWEIPTIRIFGWSADGKIAYAIERDVDGRGGQIISFSIFDTVNDKELFALAMDSFDHEADENDHLYEDLSLYLLYETRLREALAKYKIQPYAVQFLSFPAKIKNVDYKIAIDMKYGEKQHEYDEHIAEYTVSVSANGKSKTIGKFEPYDKQDTSSALAAGLIPSPFGDRAVVVIVEEGYPFEGTDISVRLSGCHLNVGFK